MIKSFADTVTEKLFLGEALTRKEINKLGSLNLERDPLKVPKPLSNPAAALIRDTIAHHGMTQQAAALAMRVSKAQLSDVLRQRKGVSANLALRVQCCFGIPGDLLIRLQSRFDYQRAWHSEKGRVLVRELECLV